MPPPPDLGNPNLKRKDGAGKDGAPPVGLRRGADELEVELAELIQRSERLKTRYDQYFMGLEKHAPLREREDLDRALLKTKVMRTNRTVLRFKYEAFIARYRTYTAYWDRILRDIEEGHFRRGIASTSDRLRFKATAKAKANAERDAAAATPKEAPKPAESRADEPKMPSAAYERLFNDYKSAKSEAGEDVAKMTYRAFEATVEKQRELARQKLGAEVDFRVKVADGKVTLVASRRKDAPATP